MQYRISLSWNTENWARNLNLCAVSWCLKMAWHTFSQLNNTGVLFRNGTSVFRVVAQKCCFLTLLPLAMTGSSVFSVCVKFWFSNQSEFCSAKALTLLDFIVSHIGIYRSVITCSQGGALVEVQKDVQRHQDTMPCFCFCPEDNFPSVLEGAVNFSRWLQRITIVQ